jgi:threonine aldolase
MGEDPTINRLQEMAAEQMGKEAGLFVPSGTMGNLIAILTHCNRGDEIIVGSQGHTHDYEAGGAAALGGVHSYVLKNQPDGTLNLDEVRAAIREDDVHYPVTRLVIMENTHNRCGGIAISADYTWQLSNLAHENDLNLHLDGARIFNAAAFYGVEVRQLTEAVDSVTFCLSKGLCAPVGSVLCGTNEFIKRALRIRKQLGGGMRQAGILAAAGIYALEHMIDRLEADQRRARQLEAGLLNIPWLKVEQRPTSTNMVFAVMQPNAPLSPAELIEKMNAEDILLDTSGPRRLRLVTHYWVDDDDVSRVIQAFGRIAS